jgi:8-oxo-dGTP pyrophosphatase MutT (NUDIX family)
MITADERVHALSHARINTAGAYVCVDGYYLFAMGTKLHNGCIPVVRLGGHREENETGWQCAEREVFEEASLRIQPVLPQTTYLADWDHLEELDEISWQVEIEQGPIPCLVVVHQRENSMHLSLMYLAHAVEIPKPSSEVKGLVLLTPEEIHRLCRGPLTLEQYLSRGGRAIWNTEFDKRLVLEPFAQLRLLSRILSLRPERLVPG